MQAVIDTGVLVSALIRKQEASAQVLHLLRDGRFTVVYSTPLLVELVEVLSRSKIKEKYHVQPNDITALVDLIRLRGELVIPERKITACRDPKDDKFLEAAAAGRADCIVTGDRDLLELDPFEGIPVISIAVFTAYQFFSE